MKLKYEQLPTHLRNGLKPVYIIAGDEILLSQESCDMIRQAARDNGFEEREVYHVEGNFDWGQVLEGANAMSLFASRKIMEIRIPSGKAGDSGNKALLEMSERPNPDNLLIIVLPKLDKTIQNQKWFKNLELSGVLITLWPVERHQLPQWISQRMSRLGLSADGDALQILADRADGNLLAAVQEIEKLNMQGIRHVTLAQIEESVADTSRYDVFALSECAFNGETRRALHVLEVLKGEGFNPLQPLAIISNEIRQLCQIKQLMETGKTADQALQSLAINWPKKQQQFKKAAQRISLAQSFELLKLCEKTDQATKSILADDPWRLLSLLTLSLSGAKNLQLRA